MNRFGISEPVDDLYDNERDLVPEWPSDHQMQDWNEANDYTNEGEDDELEEDEDDDGYVEYDRDDIMEDQFLDSEFEDRYEPDEY